MRIVKGSLLGAFLAILALVVGSLTFGYFFGGGAGHNASSGGFVAGGDVAIFNLVVLGVTRLGHRSAGRRRLGVCHAEVIRAAEPNAPADRASESCSLKSAGRMSGR